MRENLDKARSLLSTRMDDVRALKRMVSDTKETIEQRRKERIMQEIRGSGQYGEHFKTTSVSTGQKNYLLGCGRPSMVQINHREEGQRNHKPAQSYADLIAAKYYQQQGDSRK